MNESLKMDKNEDIENTAKFVNKFVLINSFIVEILLVIIKLNVKSIVMGSQRIHYSKY